MFMILVVFATHFLLNITFKLGIATIIWKGTGLAKDVHLQHDYSLGV